MLQPVISKSRKDHVLCGTMYGDKLQLQKKTGRIERLFTLFFFETCFKKVILDPWSWGNEYKAFSDILSGPLTLFRPVFFLCFLRRRGGGGGGGEQEVSCSRPYNFKNAHDTATKITQNNVLIIPNI